MLRKSNKNTHELKKKKKKKSLTICKQLFFIRNFCYFLSQGNIGCVVLPFQDHYLLFLLFSLNRSIWIIQKKVKSITAINSLIYLQVFQAAVHPCPRRDPVWYFPGAVGFTRRSSRGERSSHQGESPRDRCRPAPHQRG